MSDDPCISHVLAASVVENEGIELDRAGQSQEAIRKYEECVAELSAAIAAAETDHAEDKPKLQQHRKEIQDRIGHLKSLKGAPATIPVEDQIRAVQLGMQAAGEASEAVGKAGGVKTLAACAAIGAGAGFLVLGGAVGCTLSVVGGAAGAAYLATRKDKAGDLARGCGEAGIAAVHKAKELDEKHHITEKVVDVSKGAWQKAKETDTKYNITTKIGQGISKVTEKAKDIEGKHNVTEKVASGFSAGLGKLSQVVSGAGAAAAARTSTTETSEQRPSTTGPQQEAKNPLG